MVRDPLGFSAGDVNLYRYVGNNPVSLRDPSGLYLEKIFNDPAERGANIERAITAQEFIEHARGRDLRTLQYESESEWWQGSGGPSYNYRYIIDPGNPEQVIDMRHFLSMGPWGEEVGLLVEIGQLAFWRGSAMNSQDFLSNWLGSRFFNEYYRPDGCLAEQLETFFMDRYLETRIFVD